MAVYTFGLYLLLPNPFPPMLLSMPKKSKNAPDGEIITISKGLAIFKVGASPFW